MVKTPNFVIFVSFVAIGYFLSGLRLLHAAQIRFFNPPAKTL